MTIERIPIGAYVLELHDYDDAHQTAKGYFVGAKLIGSDVSYAIVFYDPVRLAQDIEATFSTDALWFEPNLVVIHEINRQHMRAALAKMIEWDELRRLAPDPRPG